MPGSSFGVNENGVRHCGQKPSERPGRPSRERPTGAPQLEQKRRFSGTLGSASTAFAGSSGGTDGIVVRPAPSRAPRSRVEEVPSLRVVREPPARTEPSGVLASRFEDDVTEERVETAPSVPATAPVALGSSGRPWPPPVPAPP